MTHSRKVMTPSRPRLPSPRPRTDGLHFYCPSELDYETTTSYDLTVQVSDPEGLTDTATYTIMVTDVNERPVMPAYTKRTTYEKAWEDSDYDVRRARG